MKLHHLIPLLSLALAGKKADKIINYFNPEPYDIEPKLNEESITLGYVTPWHGYGYDIAKWNNKKFNIISPVWIQVTPSFAFTGLHDVDDSWIDEVRSNRNTKIFPRVLFQNWSVQDVIDQLPELANHLNDLAEKHKFNGFVIEMSWQNLMYQATAGINKVLEKIEEFGENSEYELIMVLPPMQARQNSEFDKFGVPSVYYHFFTPQFFDQIEKYFIAFQIMTYDYNGVRDGLGMPNAPYNWVRDSINGITGGSRQRAKKVLLGLNFYGRFYSEVKQDAIIGSEFLKRIKETKSPMKLSWDKNFQEYKLFIEDGRVTYFYPSVKSIQKRLELADQLGCGVAIWELGQGMENFMEAFRDRDFPTNHDEKNDDFDEDRYLDEL